LFFDETKIEEVARRLQSLGFKYVALDLMGYRSGSMNAALGPDEVR